MLIIRNEQMEAFNKEAERVFHKRLFQFSRDNYLEQTQHYSDEELQSVLARKVAEAEAYGMVMQADIAEYVGLTLLDLNGDLPGRIKEILEDPGIPAETKLLQLNHLVETQRSTHKSR